MELLSRAHANLYDFSSSAPYAPAGGGLVRETYKGRWVGLEERIAYSPDSRLRFTVGGEGQRHFLASLYGKDETGNVYLPKDENRYWVLGVYGLSDADVTRWLRVSAGVRFDAFLWQFAAKDVKSSSIDPRAAVILLPYAGGVTKLVAGKAFRAPTIYERFYHSSVQRTSLDLEPEQVFTAELEHTHRFSSSVVGVASVFGNYVKNLVVGRGEGTEASPLYFVNSKTPVLTYGSELELRRDFREGFMLSGSYSFQRSVYLNPAAEDGLEGGAHVPNSPNHVTSLKGAAPIVGEAFKVMTRLGLTSARYDRNEAVADPPQGTTPAGIVWDVVFSGRIMDDRLHYNVGAYNIGDFRFSAPVSAEFRMTSVVQNGRTLLAALTLTL
jgi:outer membrane receptor protein involved in Fe transport